MNQDALIQLARYSKAGDESALEELLLWAHTPVSFLCNKLLLDPETVQNQTQEILYIISQKIRTLQDPSLIEKWVIRLTIAKCLQVLPSLRWMSNGNDLADSELNVAGETLNQEQTVDAVQSMVDMLPEKPRVCITLLCCGDMHSNDIAKATGYSVDVVHKNMAIAQTYVVEQIEKYQDMGTEFYPIDSLKEVLLNAMYQQPSDDAMAVVYAALGKEMPVPVDPDRGKKILLRVALVLLVILIVALAGLNFWVRKKNTFSPEDYTPAQVTIPTLATEPEETTEATTAETTEAETEPEETTAETEAPVETEPTTTEETKADAKEASAKTPASSKPSTLGPGKEVPAEAPSTGEDGHTHRYLTTKSNINCETGGTRRYECADCDYYYTENIGPSGSHSFITVPSGMAEHKATCTAPGKALKTCTKCNYAETVADAASKPALGHDYTASVVAPTATEQGYTLHKCSRCGDSYKDTYVDPISPAQTEAIQAPAEAESGEDQA